MSRIPEEDARRCYEDRADCVEARAQLAAVTGERDRLRFLIDGSTASCQRAADEIDRLRADLIESQRKYIVLAQAAAGLNHAIESTSAEQLARAVLGLRADLDAARQREAAAVGVLRAADAALLHAISALGWLPPDSGPIKDQACKAVRACREARERIAAASSPPPVDAATRGIVEAVQSLLHYYHRPEYSCKGGSESDEHPDPACMACQIEQRLRAALSAYLAAHPSTDGGGQ